MFPESEMVSAIWEPAPGKSENSCASERVSKSAAISALKSLSWFKMTFRRTIKAPLRAWAGIIMAWSQVKGGPASWICWMRRAIALKAPRTACSQWDRHPLNLRSKRIYIDRSSAFGRGDSYDDSRNRDREDPATSRIACAKDNRLYRLHCAQSSSQNSQLFDWGRSLRSLGAMVWGYWWLRNHTRNHINSANQRISATLVASKQQHILPVLSTHPKTLELLRDRALNDPDEQLREWAQEQLKMQNVKLKEEAWTNWSACDDPGIRIK